MKIVLNALLLAAVFAPASWTQAPVVIRAETREVAMDVAVTGKKGDLTAKDFSVFEDGKPQKIDSVVGAAADLETSVKHFVIYFDFAGMPLPDQAESQRAAAGFVEALASPDRYMAVMSMGGNGPRVLQDFTTAPAALKNAVMATQASVTRTGGASGVSAKLSDSLTQVCRSVAPATGRKALLLFSPGYPDSYALGTGSGGMLGPFKETTTVCNRANVAIYVISGNGAGSGISASSPLRQSSCAGCNGIVQPDTPQTVSANFGRMLGDGTGGGALNIDGSLKDRLAAIAREQDEYYRVFYTPPPAKEDSCHTIKIAMNVRGLAARARNEYCTEKPVDAVAGKIAGQGLEAQAARAAGAGSLRATAQLPYFYTGANRATVHASVDLVPEGMKFEKDKTGLHGQLDIVATVVRPDGVTAARFADTVDIDKDDQAGADAFTRTPWHYEHQFTVAAGIYVVRLAIGAGPNAVGQVEVPLTVEPWSSAKLGIGGIAFSTVVRAVDGAAADGGPVLEGRGPLVAGGRQFMPASTNRFQRSVPLYFYTEVYDAVLGVASAPSLAMQYRILDGKTGEVRAETGMAGIGGYLRPGDSVVPFATRLPVEQLPPGSYKLEVRAAIPSSQEIVARTIDFELN